MINPWCPSDLQSGKKYVAKAKYINECRFNNSTFDFGEEKKLDRYYTEIIKRKLLQLKYRHHTNIKILDICGGSGFLTYHLYKIFGKKNKYHLVDINKNEVKHASKLLGSNVKFQTDDFLSHVFKTKYDLIIGNSFLHHFTNVPHAIKKIFSILNTHGCFINLHEPGEKAAFIESIGRDSLAETARLLKTKKHHEGTVGTDLWMFNYNDLKKMLEQSGFKKIIIYKTGFLRTIFETLFKYSSKKRINQTIRTFLNINFNIDSIILNNFEFPFFSSFFFIAFKNNNENKK